MVLNFISSLPRHRSKRRFLRFQKRLILTIKEKSDAILKIRQGSRLSRVFRHLFNQRRIKTILGGNLALLAIISSVYSPPVSALGTIVQTDTATLSVGAVELTTKNSVRLPLDEIRPTQGFSFFHPGIDLDGETGDPVYPIMKGKVESIVYDRFGLGKHIIIAHGSGFKSVYAHLSKIEIEVGEEVETNQEIGQVGSTGRSFGDHLHLELLDNDRHINPRTILPIK